MKVLFLIISITSFINGYSQTYEEAVTQCAKNYQEGLKDLIDKRMDAEIMKKNAALRQCIVGKRFPGFESTNLKDKPFSSSDLEGKVVLINLWFIACPPCVAEMPMLNELADEYKGKDFKLISFGTDNKEAIDDFLSKRKAKYEIFPSSHDLIQKTFKMTFGYPTQIFLNKKGEIVEFKTGGPTEEPGLKATKEQFKRIIERELGK